MKVALRLVTTQCNIYYFDDKGTKILGLSPNLTGNISGLWGDIGGLTGNVDDCEITDEEREEV